MAVRDGGSMRGVMTGLLAALMVAFMAGCAMGALLAFAHVIERVP